MYHINQAVIGSSEFVSSSVAEDDHPEWSAATDYTVGDCVIRPTTHRRYENLIAGVDATYPENATEGTTPRWLDLGPTNRWAGLDGEVGTKTVVSSSSVESRFNLGSFDSFALYDAIADEVVISYTVGGGVVFEKLYTLRGYSIGGWYDYWFAPRAARKGFVVGVDLPRYAAAEVTVTINSEAGVSFALLMFGSMMHLGQTQKRGFSMGIKDYSVKETNEFGVLTGLVERGFAKTCEGQTKFLHNRTEEIYAYMASQRAKLGLWIPGKESGFEYTYIYGFLVDFRVHSEEVPVASTMNFEIEGVI